MSCWLAYAHNSENAASGCSREWADPDLMDSCMQVFLTCDQLSCKRFLFGFLEQCVAFPSIQQHWEPGGPPWLSLVCLEIGKIGLLIF